MVILSGTVEGFEARYIQRLRESINAVALLPKSATVQIGLAPEGSRAVAYGAAARLLYSTFRHTRAHFGTERDAG